MPELSPLERCLEKADIAVQRLMQGKHLCLPLSDKSNYLRTLNWIDPMFDGIAPPYTICSLLKPREEEYVADVGEKIFRVNAMAERAYLARFLKGYYHPLPEGKFLFWEHLRGYGDETKKELNQMAKRVVLKEKLGKDEYLVMFGVYFLQRALKYGLIEPKGYFLKYNGGTKYLSDLTLVNAII